MCPHKNPGPFVHSTGTAPSQSVAMFLLLYVSSYPAPAPRCVSSLPFSPYSPPFLYFLLFFPSRTRVKVSKKVESRGGAT
jgi:hypothetical protein